MEQKIKMIWDFRGPNANQTAKHHVIHLKEFMDGEKLPYHGCDVVSQNEFGAFAYLIVNQNQVTALRAQLKPHRGQISE